MHYVVYMSKASTIMKNKDLEAILEVSRKNNEASGITGMLLYRNQLFIQMLEGEEVTVKTLYEKIFNDARHFECRLMDEGTSEERFFSLVPSSIKRHSKWRASLKIFSYNVLTVTSSPSNIWINN
ncbi:MAG: BLUF domain-containing protein [Pseudomonadota bacterium]